MFDDRPLWVMSALGQKQTLQPHDLMFALPPKADIRHCSGSCGP
jgi:hypothetical protein